MSEAKGNSPAPGQAKADAKPQGKPKAEPGNDGFIVGLQFWVVFLVAFVLLRFPLALAIAFGSIAGLAGGFCVSWWQDEKQLKNQSKDSALKPLGDLAKLDTEILLNPDTDFSEESVDPRKKRRSAYVSNRPYNVEERRRGIKSVLPWRGNSSRPRV